MPAFKTSAAPLLASLAASAFFTPVFCTAATLVVNGEQPLSITTPPGFTYVSSGGTGSLTVTTDGFLFCANVYPDNPPTPTPVTVIPHHGSWMLPMAQDVSTVAYNLGVLGVNHADQTSLVCHAVDAQGRTLSPRADGLLRNGYETTAIEQFSNLVNWVPTPGFNWNAPDWSLVPTNPCDTSPAEVNETVACAGVSGVTQAGAAVVRAPIMWTGTDGSNFFYVARVDARYGTGNIIDSGMHLPASFTSAPATPATAVLKLIEAYDRGSGGAGGYLGDTGQWCAMTVLPATLDANICANAPYSQALTSALSQFIYLQSAPLGTPVVSFYAAFVRPIVGAPPSLNEPAVALTVLFEPSVSGIGGDTFTGDDVAFGFLPASNGFSCMPQ
jgi:hypothetical protein